MTFDHAFHGRTLLAMSLTAKVMPYKQGMGPFAPEIYRLPFAYPYRWLGDPERCTEEALAYAVDEMHKHIGEENIAAVIMEPIQGEGGFIVPSPGFVKGIADFCAAHGIVFIADEIQIGHGPRRPRGTRSRTRASCPTSSRPRSRSAAACRSAPSPAAPRSWTPCTSAASAGTYGGNPVAAAASLAVLDKIEREDLLSPLARVGDTIMSRFDDIAGAVRRRSATSEAAARCARWSSSSDRATKEPLGRRRR